MSQTSILDGDKKQRQEAEAGEEEDVRALSVAIPKASVSLPGNKLPEQAGFSYGESWADFENWDSWRCFKESQPNAKALIIVVSLHF